MIMKASTFRSVSSPMSSISYRARPSTVKFKRLVAHGHDRSAKVVSSSPSTCYLTWRPSSLSSIFQSVPAHHQRHYHIGSAARNFLIATRCDYSTSRYICEGDKSKGSSSSMKSQSSSSLVDSIGSQANKLLEQSIDFSNQVFTKSSKIVEKGATEASSTASSLASKTIDETQKLTKKLTEQATATASSLANTALDESQKLTAAALSESQRLAQRAASETSKIASTTLQTATRRAGELGRQVSSSTEEAMSNAVDNCIHKPIQQTSQRIKDTSEEIVESITSSSTKLIKWLAWWSLAAVAVYGLVTTLPIALIKYATERRHQNDDDESKGGDRRRQQHSNSDGKVGDGQERIHNNKVWSYVQGLFGQSPKDD